MAEIKEFLSGAEDATDVAELLPRGKPLVFRLNGREIAAHPPANSGPFAYMVAMQADDAEAADATYGMLLFFDSIVSTNDARWLRKGLATGELSFSAIADVFSWLIEEWSARPTTPPRGSSSRRRSTGGQSMGSAPSTG